MDDNEFLKTYENFIRTFAYKYCRHEEDKQDFEQELRIRLWKAWKSHYDPVKGKLSTWVYKTLQLHSRKLRFDTLKQQVFEKELLNSDYFNEENYKYDPYFLSIAWETSLGQLKSEEKFPEFEHRIHLCLSEKERSVYNLVLQYYPNLKIPKVAKKLDIPKEEVEKIYEGIKIKVFNIYEELYKHI